MIYEAWRKKESKGDTRKYVVVAEDTAEAKLLVAKYITNHEQKEFFLSDLDIGYPDEMDLRQRDSVAGGWWRGSVWDDYQYYRGQNKTGVIYTYII